MRLGLIGVDSSHAEDFLRHFNAERRHDEMRVTAVWGEDPARLDALCAVAPDVQAADSVAALVDAVDAVIVGDRHGVLHRPHALAAVGAGKPVFIDKPLATTLADATAIVDAAARAGVPLCSGSALRWQAETRRLKARLMGLDAPIALTAYGTWYPESEYGGAIFYAIHTIELAQELTGVACTDVRRVDGSAASVRYQAGPHEVMLEFRAPAGSSSDFGVQVRSGGVAFAQAIPLGDDYMRPVADRIAAMLHDGHGGMSREELLAPVAMMEEIARVLTQ